MRSLRFLSPICVVVVTTLLAPEVTLAQYSINSIAGGGPNNLPALQASIGYPESIAMDAAGNTYIAESSYSSQVLKVSASGTVTVVAGNGTTGYSGDGGSATSAALYQPEGVFVDASGNIFIADTENSVIREVVASTGNIQTVVGVNYDSGGGSSCLSGGDGGPATSAYLCLPYSVFVDGSGNIFIADFGNSTIREVVASTGNIKTVAGTPDTPGYVDGVLATSAELDLAAGVYVDASGNIFIADTFNSVIRVVNPGSQAVTIAGTSIPAGYIQTVAGQQYDSIEGSACQFTGDNGPALSAYLCLPFGVAVDSAENIFVADYANFAIREVVAAGTISTVAGTLGTDCTDYSLTAPTCGDGGLATSATLNYPSGVYVDGSDDIFIADTEDFEVREVTASNGDIQAFAGNATEAYSGDGGSPTNAELNNPGDVFVDGSGNVFIADTSNSAIREVVASSGDIQTVAGNGVAGYSGDGVSATATELNFPGGVFVDAQGDIFIADTANSAIREVVAATGLIQTVAGTPGTAGYSGDGGAATSAQLNNPNGVFVDSSGDIYIADSGNAAIREVVASTGKIQTVAGTPTQTCDAAQTPGCGDNGPATSAYLNFPNAIYLDAASDIFIADTFDNAIREVSAATGTIQTVAGTLGTPGFSGNGAAATSALLNTPYGVFLDGSNDIYIADSDNAAIREVVAATGFIQTIAGTPPTAGFSGDGGSATSAELNAPSGVFGNPAGNLFIADTNNSRIRELIPAPLTVMVGPSTATVVVSALQQYTATVTGNPNTSVNWFVNGVAGGNLTVGTISATGLFQAPGVVPSPATVTITAVSQVDNTTSGSAQATIANPSATVTVTVSTNPAVTQVYTSTVQPFIATVTGTSNTAVTWYVEGAQGGSAAFGTIDTSGNYTGPANVPSPATVVIEAVSQADATAVGTESITIVTQPSAAQPAPQTVSPGGTANYSLALNVNTGSPTQTITLSCLQSSLPSGATCTFSPPTITPSSTSNVPFALAVTVPSNSGSLQKSSAIGPSSPLLVAFVPLVAFVMVGAASRSQRRRLSFALVSLMLLALLGCTSGKSSSSTPVTYTIKIQGSTAAQPNPVTITTASLTVQ